MGVGSPLNLSIELFKFKINIQKCFNMIIYLYTFLFYPEIMTPSLMNILKDNTLTGDNYVTWKRKIGLLLQVEKHKFILSAPKPPAPTYESQIHMVGKVATDKTRQKVKKQHKKKQLGPTKKETKKVTKIKGKCFLCGEKGHWKRNCPKSQNKKEQEGTR